MQGRDFGVVGVFLHSKAMTKMKLMMGVSESMREMKILKLVMRKTTMVKLSGPVVLARMELDMMKKEMVNYLKTARFEEEWVFGLD